MNHSKSQILITGGAGFIGSNLAKKYKEDGFSVAILDNFSSGKRAFVPEGCEVFEGDIGDGKFVEAVFRSFKPNIVSHHAAHISVRDSLEKPDFDAEKNILGSINIFNTAGKFNIQNVVFASTGGAMMPSSCTTFPSPEQTGDLELASPYALSKFCAEKYLKFFAKKYGFASTIFRYANIYGPRQTPKGEAGVISIFLEKMLKHQTPSIFGDGTQTRDFLFVDDLVKAHFLATEKNIEGTFHLGTGTETSILELYETIAKQVGFSQKPMFEAGNASELSRSCLDSAAFENASGWKMETEFKEGIAKTMEWWKQNNF